MRSVKMKAGLIHREWEAENYKDQTSKTTKM